MTTITNMNGIKNSRRKRGGNKKQRSTGRTAASASSSSATMHSVCMAGLLLTMAAPPLSAAFECSSPVAVVRTSHPARLSPESHVHSAIRRARGHTTSPVRLNFRDQDDGIVPSAGKSPAASTPTSSQQGKGWWTSLFSMPATSAEAGVSETESDAIQQEAVDEYLEFLDRRYRRLHTPESVVEEKQKQKQKQPFSAMQWIINGQSKSETLSEEKQKDALYVLGVAGLASQKLLQKYQPSQDTQKQRSASAYASATAVVSDDDAPSTMNRKSVDTTRAATVEFTRVEDVPAAVDSSAANSRTAVEAVLPLLRLIYVIQHRRRQTIRFVSRHARALGGAVLRTTVRSIVNAPRKTLLWSGGKKNLAMTYALASTLFILLSPVVQAFLAEGPM